MQPTMLHGMVPANDYLTGSGAEAHPHGLTFWGLKFRPDKFKDQSIAYG